MHCAQEFFFSKIHPGIEGRVGEGKEERDKFLQL
jgi:hypothetical protein